jgi:hypothetical protein
MTRLVQIEGQEPGPEITKSLEETAIETKVPGRDSRAIGSPGRVEPDDVVSVV